MYSNTKYTQNCLQFFVGVRWFFVILTTNVLPCKYPVLYATCWLLFVGVTDTCDGFSSFSPQMFYLANILSYSKPVEADLFYYPFTIVMNFVIHKKFTLQIFCPIANLLRQTCSTTRSLLSWTSSFSTSPSASLWPPTPRSGAYLNPL